MCCSPNVCFAHLGLGILPLHVETGRFNNTPVDERICKLCDQNVVEDETHFILHCSKYEVERRNMFLKVKQQQVNFETLSEKTN